MRLTDPRTLRGAIAALGVVPAVTGPARLAGSRHRGRPAARYEALTAVELVLPVALVLWPRAVRRRVLVGADDRA